MTLRYWGQQAGIAFGVVAMFLYLLLMTLTAVIGEWQWQPFWIAVGCVFVLERTVTVWAGGWSDRTLAFPLVVELAYDIFIQVVFVRCLADFLTRRPPRWHHPGEPWTDTAAGL